MIVPDEDNNGDDPENGHNGDLYNNNGSDSSGDSGNTNVDSETVSGTSPQASDSGDQNGNNSGGAEQEQGSASRTQQNTGHAESSRANLPKAVKWRRSHPEDQIIGDAGARVQTRRATANECQYSGFLFQMEPKKVHEALRDPDWVIAI